MKLYHPNGIVEGSIDIPSSKSLSNRWLIFRALYPNSIFIQNLSTAEDTRIIHLALSSKDKKINLHHAGAALRFLTAFFAFQKRREIILFGSERLHQRPIAPLVEALRQMGANISYLEKKGFAPLRINGTSPIGNLVEIDASQSSQFITALALVAPSLPKGLHIQWRGNYPSKPYLEMTLNLLKILAVDFVIEDSFMKIYPKSFVEPTHVVIESDWSSASYFFSIAALSQSVNLRLRYFSKESTQGDASICDIFKNYFGVNYTWIDDELILSKSNDFKKPDFLEFNLNATPDIAQTIAVTAAALKIPFRLTGLETLPFKETNRLLALQNELQKIGVETQITSSTIESLQFKHEITTPLTISTYSDHRMAMAFAPLALLYPLVLENPDVVKKSYPEFWVHLTRLGFQTE